MKNQIKKFVALLLCTGLVASVAALSACGDGRGAILIEGDFSTEATTEQVAELKTLLADVDESDIMGSGTEENFNRNVRIYNDGEIEVGISAAGDGQTMDINILIDIYMDHTVTMAFTSESQSVRGTGTMDMSMKNESVFTEGSNEESEITEMSYKGDIYNDMQNMYINGTISGKDGTEEMSETGKFVTSMGMLGAGSQFGVDLSALSGLIGSEGVKFYIDDGETTKVKVSLDQDAWAAVYGDMMGGMTGMGDVMEQMLDDVRFNRYDFYLEFDANDMLLGYGADIDVSLDTEITMEGNTATVKVVTKLSSWMVTTDTEAGELPSDLDDYVDMDSIV